MKKEKLSIGTKVEIIGNSNDHGFEIGDVVEVIDDVTHGAIEPGYNLYRCKGKNHGSYMVRDYDMEIIKEETLLEQAIRMYPVGTKFNAARGNTTNTYVVESELDFRQNDDGAICTRKSGNGTVYFNGKWAEIIKEETLLEKAIRLYPVGTKFRTSKSGVLRTIASTIEVYTKSPLILACETVESDRLAEVYTDGKWAEIIKEETKTTNMITTQTVTREQLKTLHSKVCSKWQSRIEETIKSNVFADSYEVSNELLKEAFKEADTAQTAALLKVFTKPGNDYVTLATGDHFEADVFETRDIVIGKGAVPVEFKGKSIIFDSDRYEAVIMPNPQKSSERDTMIVFKEK